jgi:hypothetical protein
MIDGDGTRRLNDNWKWMARAQIMGAYAAKNGLDVQHLKFVFEGARLNGGQTPDDVRKIWTRTCVRRLLAASGSCSVLLAGSPSGRDGACTKSSVAVASTPMVPFAHSHFFSLSLTLSLFSSSCAFVHSQHTLCIRLRSWAWKTRTWYVALQLPSAFIRMSCFCVLRARILTPHVSFALGSITLNRLTRALLVRLNFVDNCMPAPPLLLADVDPFLTQIRP